MYIGPKIRGPYQGPMVKIVDLVWVRCLGIRFGKVRAHVAAASKNTAKSNLRRPLPCTEVPTRRPCFRFSVDRIIWISRCCFLSPSSRWCMLCSYFSWPEAQRMWVISGTGERRLLPREPSMALVKTVFSGIPKMISRIFLH